MNKYQKTIKGRSSDAYGIPGTLQVDVYSVIVAFCPDAHPGISHA